MPSQPKSESQVAMEESKELQKLAEEMSLDEKSESNEKPIKKEFVVGSATETDPELLKSETPGAANPYLTYN